MTFLNIRFPTDIRYGFSGGPVYQTEKIPGKTPADDIARLLVDVPVYEFTADLQRFAGNVDGLIAFFRLTKGGFHSFRFKDWLDYEAIDSNIGTGNGTQTAFQLRKVYDYDGLLEYRTITKPVAGSVTVKINGTPTTAFTLDAITGIINFSTAPAAAAVITASFQFDVHVKFNQDALPISVNNFSTRDASNIKLIEVFNE